MTACGMARPNGCAVSNRSGHGLAMPAKLPTLNRSLTARNRSSRPRWSITSTLRTCRPSARDCMVGSANFSSTTVRTPASRNSLASIKPIGPPPATITSIITTPISITSLLFSSLGDSFRTRRGSGTRLMKHVLFEHKHERYLCSKESFHRGCAGRASLPPEYREKNAKKSSKKAVCE